MLLANDKEVGWLLQLYHILDAWRKGTGKRKILVNEMHRTCSPVNKVNICPIHPPWDVL
jgi:hypothetical protein